MASLHHPTSLDRFRGAGMWLTLALATLALAIHAIPSLADALQFDRAAVARGEVWRVLTCHLTHWTADHLLWDVVVLVALGVIAERASRARFAIAMGAAAVSIPWAVAAVHPELATYRGLSGLDSAAFALVLTVLFRRGGAGRAVACAAGVGLVAKLAFECGTGATLFVESGGAFVPVPVAHAAGAVAGMMAGVWPLRSFKRSTPEARCAGGEWSSVAATATFTAG